MLRALDYGRIKRAREDNFACLHRVLAPINELSLTVPDGAFMYPLLVKNGREIRKRLQAEKVYVPLLWPDVFARCRPEEPEYRMAADILPLPVDQRYGSGDMEAIVGAVMDCIHEEKGACEE